MSLIYGWIKSKMAAGNHFEKLQMAISQQHINSVYVYRLCFALGYYNHCWRI